MINFKIIHLISGFLILSCGAPQKPNQVNQSQTESNVDMNMSLRSMKLIDMKKKEFIWRNELLVTEYLEIQEIEKSQEAIEKILKSQESNFLSSYRNYLLVQKLVALEINNRRYSEAAKIWEKYEKYFPTKDKEIREIIKILLEPEGSVFVTDLGKEINLGSAINPVIEASGKKLFFTGIGFPEGKGGEDIFESSMDDTVWSSRKPLSLLNTPANESVSSVSIDGTELLITGNYSSSYGNGDIFASFLTDKGWTNVRHYRQPINTEHFEGDGIKTPDGKALIFSSDRPDGLFEYHKKGDYFAGSYDGNTDLYISFRQDSGSYGSPINLGPIINSPGSERFPFLHSDNKTLYFSTNGLNGFGSMDLYKSVRLDDTWSNWSEPVHLGKFINTPNTDLNFQITAHAEKGFISFDSISSNQNRILMISPLPKRAKPEGLISVVRGVIFDEYDAPIQTEIEWVDLDDNELQGKISSRPLNGEYFLPIQVGKEYIVYPKKKNYIHTSFLINLKNEKASLDKSLDIKMTSIVFAISSGVEFNLASIQYENEKDVLLEKSFVELDRLSQMLIENPDIKIEIISHYSSSKPESYNLDLSNRRAIKVVNYLISKNINSSRIKPKGMGSSKPIVPNINDENRNKNKRTTYIISSID